MPAGKLHAPDCVAEIVTNDHEVVAT